MFAQPMAKTCCSRMFCRISERRGDEPAIVPRHPKTLQSFDLACQTLGRLTTILAAALWMQSAWKTCEPGFCAGPWPEDIDRSVTLIRVRKGAGATKARNARGKADARADSGNLARQADSPEHRRSYMAE